MELRLKSFSTEELKFGTYTLYTSVAKWVAFYDLGRITTFWPFSHLFARKVTYLCQVMQMFLSFHYNSDANVPIFPLQ